MPNVDYFDDVPSTAAIYLDPDGTPRDVGSTLKNPDLAKTYEYIGRFGADAFYRGPLAKAIADAAQKPPIAPTANHTWRPGLITEQDIASYRAIERKPTKVDYKGLEVWGMGPPSSGGSTVGEALNILEGYQPLGADRTQALHRFLEASRYAFADRGKYLGDPAFVKVPLDCLLSQQFADARRALITDRAVNAAVPGGDCGPAGVPPALSDGPSTTHLTIADEQGLRRLVHVHRRVHGRQRHRRPGHGHPAQQRADGLRLHVADRAQPRRRRQAPAQLDGAHDHHEARQAVPRGRLAGRLDDHHHRPADPAPAPGARQETCRAAIAAPRVSQRNGANSIAEPAFMPTEAPALTAQYGHAFGPPQAEIGATTGIEFFDRGKMLAAAEPVRRVFFYVAASAMVVKNAALIEQWRGRVARANRLGLDPHQLPRGGRVHALRYVRRHAPDDLRGRLRRAGAPYVWPGPGLVLPERPGLDRRNRTLADVADFIIGKPLTILAILVIAWFVNRIARQGVRGMLKTLSSGAVQERVGAMRAAAPAALLQTQEHALRSEQRIDALTSVLRSLVTFVIYTGRDVHDPRRAWASTWAADRRRGDHRRRARLRLAVAGQGLPVRRVHPRRGPVRRR